MGLVDKRVDPNITESADCPFRGLFFRRAKQGVSSDVEGTSIDYMRTYLDIPSGRDEMASTSGIYSEVLGEEFVGDNGSLLSLQPWVFKKAKCSKRVEESSDSSGRWSFDWSGFSWAPHGSPTKINSGYHSIGSRKRRQYGHNFRPVTFAEKFFLPHLCSESVGIEDYSFNFHPSPSIKDESLPRRIDPRSRGAKRMAVNSSVEQTENRHDNEFCYLLPLEKVPIDQIGGSATGKLIKVIDVPHLSLRRSRKTERKSRETMPGSLNASFSQKLCNISDPLDSLDGMFLFLLGIAIGVTMNVVSHRTEVEKLNKLLKDNKNLLQDLHEELEMEDSFTFKELANGTDGNKDLELNLDESVNVLQNQNSKWHDTTLKMDVCDTLCVTMVGKDLSEIEAELEAELEKLELNINASGKRTPDLSKLDPDLTADVVRGELREDLLIKCVTDDDKNATTASTTQACNANYSISPKELSLRLHEVIENRLEERIKELEAALEEAQMKLKLVEGERLSPMKPPFSSSDTGSSSRNSPKSSMPKNSTLRLGPSGDASMAYDEAYDEFMRLADTEDDDKLSCPPVRSGDKKLWKDNEKEQACEQILWRTGSYDVSATDDDDDWNDDDDDGFDGGKDLIQKILEKTRQGSPALLNVQKMFFMMDL